MRHAGLTHCDVAQAAGARAAGVGRGLSAGARRGLGEPRQGGGGTPVRARGEALEDRGACLFLERCFVWFFPLQNIQRSLSKEAVFPGRCVWSS